MPASKPLGTQGRRVKMKLLAWKFEMTQEFFPKLKTIPKGHFTTP